MNNPEKALLVREVEKAVSASFHRIFESMNKPMMLSFKGYLLNIITASQSIYWVQ